MLHTIGLELTCSLTLAPQHCHAKSFATRLARHNGSPVLPQPCHLSTQECQSEIWRAAEEARKDVKVALRRAKSIAKQAQGLVCKPPRPVLGRLGMRELIQHRHRQTSALTSPEAAHLPYASSVGNIQNAGHNPWPGSGSRMRASMCTLLKEVPSSSCKVANKHDRLCRSKLQAKHGALHRLSWLSTL